ncbi:error-prone DNA polymerase [Caulobacter rhizosphaerae]|jgi:error-prone DNA polymerase|uniref:error-prone DNA polymerase n=1 Tax=Caulobacter rhizosphaerae TaxID=2010972 RepID=UPI0013D2010B|nr:error-prone DNA polymerase [Caulobacter rhizosphaerae]GGL43415.1 error-prone DNA polymerase [Caulobacter rhizosphaerae]
MTTHRYAELQATTNFSFLRGASHAQELMLTGQALGLSAVGVTDRNSLAGVVRAWTAAKDLQIRALTGCRLDFMDGTPSLLCYPSDREAFARLTRLLTVGQRRAEKGECHLSWKDFLEHAHGQLALVVPPAKLDETFQADLDRMAGELRGRVWLAASRAYAAQDLKRLSRLAELARDAGAPMVATNDVLYHGPERRPLQDVMTCIREGCTITEAGFRLEANAERHLKTPAEMARLFERWPQAVERTVEIVERIGFDLSHLKEQYPDEPVPPGKTAMEHLTDLAWKGAAWRYPGGVPPKVQDNLRTELGLIAKMDYPNYFITVHDIVQKAREMGILCQGRGSAANSSVCYCLGVTAIDPMEHRLLFTRFISENRGEPPDIDVDFEHERREDVMQYVYERYGRDYAAICGTVIHYRPRSAIRDVGKALGLTEDITAILANTVWGSWGDGLPDEHIRQTGLDPKNPQIARAIALATELLQFPRHLSQHVGGFVLTKRRLDETVPIGNAAMKDRTFIEWDKDDIDSLGLMKVDILALGMLAAIQRAFGMLRADHGQPIVDLADVPVEVKGVYDMLSVADSVGVFQVESRAQMSMLPRLKPNRFYDLVIEVAIVRPGPIQGDMVHPYLRRRQGLEKAEWPAPSPEHGDKDELKGILGNTYGVPLFQEQAMSLAIEAARFTPDEADGLRKAMATFKHDGDPGQYRGKFVEGMVSRGYERDFATRCFKQIEGFGSYGFPESHAASFAKLVYVSAWIKWAWPDVFCAALINSQPMGFYQPAQLVRDAREHGVEVRAPDVLTSDWDCTLEDATPPTGRERRIADDKIFNPDTRPLWKAVRLGLRQIKGLKKKKKPEDADLDADLIMAARAAGARAPADFARAGVSQRALELLAEADAFAGAGLSRRDALWAVKGLKGEVKVDIQAPLLAGLPLFEDAVTLPAMALPQQVAEDYRTTSLSLKAHPLRFFRPQLDRLNVTPAERLKGVRDGRRVSVGGLVLIRQRPGTAKGVVFLTLEDETGVANAVVWKDCFDAHRRTVMSASFLIVHGKVQAADGVIHVVAESFTDLSAQLARMKEDPEAPAPTVRMRTSGRLQRSRDFH